MARNSGKLINQTDRPRSSAALSTGLSEGDIVAVINFCPAGGPPIYEGRAKILRATGKNNYYEVHFVGDDAKRTRFIHPHFQTGDPEQHLSLLIEMWHYANSPNHSDFFPTLDEVVL